MNVEYVHGYPFYTFQAPINLVEKILKKVNDVAYTETTSGSDNNHNPQVGYVIGNDNQKSCFYDELLYNFLDSCLEPIYKKHFTQATSHKICDLWMVKSTFGSGAAAFHYHVNSIFSGVFYLHDSKTSTLFKFDDPLTQNLKKIVNCTNEFLYHKIQPEQGKVVIWPSSIPHKIEIHREKQTRYTVAFNSFWDGEISNSASTALHINTKPCQNINIIT